MKVSRRKFLAKSILGGTGLLVGIAYLAKKPIRRTIAGKLNTLDSPYVGETTKPSVWFEVNPDNTITLFNPKVEMGQGSFTGIAQLAAEELGVPFELIKVEHAASTNHIDGFGTGGSTSIPSLWMPVRELAATMREMLKTEAAKKLGTTNNKISFKENGFEFNGKHITLAETVAGVSEWEIPDSPKLKDQKDFKFIGKPLPRVDLHQKVTGAPIFGIDATLPGMLYGAVARPTHVTAVLNGVDSTKAEKMPGVVKIVKEKDFIGVIANSRTEAENAKQALIIDWKIDKKWTQKEIEDLIAVGKGTPIEIQKEGKPDSILDDQKDLITAEFKSPLGAHAQLEPNGALAHVEGNKATIYMSTQVVKITRAEIAKRLKLDEENVIIKPTFLGGGFGRRLHTPNGIQAAVMSKAVGKPVKSYFTRQEEFQNDTFRPPTHHVLKAKLNSSGLIDAIEHNVSSGDVLFGSPLIPGIAEPLLGADLGAWRGAMIQYSKIPNIKTVSWRVKLPFATSMWRALGLLANTLAVESFMDELALKAGKSPVQFRLDQINDDKAGKRLKAVIKLAAEKSSYTEEVIDGKAMGFAASTDVNVPVAQVAEVSIVNNEIKVHKVTCVIDPGLAVNPDQIRAQCEGAINMGISASMYEKMNIIDGQLDPIIYGPYRMAKIGNTPKEINVHILENDNKPGGVGEPPIGPIAAAISNAAFRLTGKRLREMPFV